MKLAENKVYMALEGHGTVPNPSHDLGFALMVDAFTEKYGWEFVKEAFDIEEISTTLFANLKGILQGELKKQKMDNLRNK